MTASHLGATRRGGLVPASKGGAIAPASGHILVPASEEAPTRASEEAAFDAVAIACSAGGLMAVRELLARLPDRFPAAVVVLLHWPTHKPLELPSVERRSALPVTLVDEGDPLKPASVFLAPPDRHLLIKPDRSFLLSRTPRLHFVRPSADLLFESLSASYGPRAIAVILSGLGSDGSIGVKSVKAAGGIVVAQDQATAEHFTMPKAAIDTGCVDYVLPLGQIAPILVSLVNQRRNLPT